MQSRALPKRGNAEAQAVYGDRQLRDQLAFSEGVQQEDGGRAMAHNSQPGAGTVARAWQSASRIVRTWPELTIAWADWYDRPAHLVVQSEAGASLHFENADGPLLATDDAETRLRWADVEHLDATNRFNQVNWIGNWGAPSTAEPTAKAAIYAAIAALIRPDGSDGWTARPANIVFDSDDPLDDPYAVFRLLSAFPTLVATVRWYASQVSVGLRRGSRRELGWHEPLWLVARNDHPVAVLDEAGRVHLARISTNDDNLADLLELVADDADWVAGGFSFDILQALNRLDGDLDALMTLIVPGARHAFGPRRSWNPADPNRAQEPPRRLPPISAESDADTSGECSPDGSSADLR